MGEGSAGKRGRYETYDTRKEQNPGEPISPMGVERAPGAECGSNEHADR